MAHIYYFGINETEKINTLISESVVLNNAISTTEKGHLLVLAKGLSEAIDHYTKRPIGYFNANSSLAKSGKNIPRNNLSVLPLDVFIEGTLEKILDANGKELTSFVQIKTAQRVWLCLKNNELFNKKSYEVHAAWGYKEIPAGIQLALQQWVVFLFKKLTGNISANSMDYTELKKADMMPAPVKMILDQYKRNSLYSAHAEILA
jgi:hypothetical protein